MVKQTEAEELIHSLPKRFRPELWDGRRIVYHLKLTGENEKHFTILVDDGVCKIINKLVENSTCTIITTEDVYVAIEKKVMKAHVALFSRKLKINNIPATLSFINLFKRFNETG